MGIYVYFFLITVYYIFRIFYLKLFNKQYTHLFVSYFLLSIPFELGKSFSNVNPSAVAGTLGPDFLFYLPICSLFLMFFSIFGLNPLRDLKNYKKNEWILFVFFFILISYFYNINGEQTGTKIFAFFFFTHIFLFVFISKLSTLDVIIAGIFDGFKLLSIIQLILAICFPLLGMKSVTGLFHVSGLDWASRLGGRDGAIGLYQHPGNFATFLIIAVSFFIGAYFEGYKRQWCILLICSNIFSLYLTSSRISIISFVVIMFLLFRIQRNPQRKIISLRSMLLFFLPCLSFLYWIIFESSFSELFLKSDSSQQYDNRLVHWAISIKIFFDSPYVGVGLNSHLAYIKKNTSIVTTFTTDDFFSSNPIHNIHLIVLAELGIVGFIAWIIFLTKNFILAKRNLYYGNNQILSYTFIGTLLVLILNGFTGWGPFSPSILPLFFFICFFTRKFSL